VPDLRVGHLPAPEHHRQLNLVTLCEQARGRPHLQLDVVLSRARAEADLVDHCSALVLAGVPLLLGLLVLELAVVQDAADGRDAVGVDFDEVKPGLAGAAHCVGKGNHPNVISVCAYKADLSRPDPLVNAKLAENRLAPLSENYRHDRHRSTHVLHHQ